MTTMGMEGVFARHRNSHPVVLIKPVDAYRTLISVACLPIVDFIFDGLIYLCLWMRRCFDNSNGITKK